MGKKKPNRRYAQLKCVSAPPRKKEKEEKETVREVAKASTALYFQYNTQLGPPYHIIIDTNFIHFSIKNKIDLFQGTVDCLYAECKLYITDCVMGELEKLGTKYRVGLKIAKVRAFVQGGQNEGGRFAAPQDSKIAMHASWNLCR